VQCSRLIGHITCFARPSIRLSICLSVRSTGSSIKYKKQVPVTPEVAKTILRGRSNRRVEFQLKRFVDACPASRLSWKRKRQCCRRHRWRWEISSANTCSCRSRLKMRSASRLLLHMVRQ